MKKERKLMNFRCDNERQRKLNVLSEKWDITKSDIIRVAIDEFCHKYYENTEKYHVGVSIKEITENEK